MACRGFSRKCVRDQEVASSNLPAPILFSFLQRLRFALKHRSLRRIVRFNTQDIAVCGSQGERRVPRFCPHQGADLSKAWIKEDHLICHWHGCRYRLSDGKFITPNRSEKLR